MRKVEIKMPTVAKVITGNLTFLKFLASICIDPANKRKPSMPFISRLWKSIEVIIFMRGAASEGNKLPAITSNTEHMSDKAMIPMVDGHLINL